MTVDDLVGSLTNMGIAFDRQSADYGQQWYITDDISYGVSAYGATIIEMWVRTTAYASSLGVKVGDPTSKVQQLYGDGYNRDDYLLRSAHTWEYYDGQLYMDFCLDENNQNVQSWGISTYSLNDDV